MLKVIYGRLIAWVVVSSFSAHALDAAAYVECVCVANFGCSS